MKKLVMKATGKKVKTQRERKVPSVKSLIKIVKNKLFKEKEEVGVIYYKHGFYEFLKSKGIEPMDIVSKKVLPEEAIYIPSKKKVVVITTKNQKTFGSVDEKLLSCHFKKKQLEKLVASLDVTIEYAFVLNEWFKKDCYKDTLDYIEECGCSYYFDKYPLEKILD